MRNSKTCSPFLDKHTNPASAGKKGNMNTLNEAQVRLFASPNAWMTDEALRQLYAAAKLEGMRLAVGFPDLHSGRSGPVGAAFVTEGYIYPHLIGGDIGCGMALFKTDLVQRDIKLDRWSEVRFDLEHPWEGDVSEILADCDLDSTGFDGALGTIGEGNHFAELQKVEEVLDATAFKQFDLGKQQLVVLVHSGSRGLGESILREYSEGNGTAGCDAEGFAGAAYLRDHDLAVRWAEANRALIARRFAEALGAEAGLLWDGCHNSITPLNCRSRRKEALIDSDLCAAGAEEVSLLTSAATYIHRKGAVAAEGDFVVIPGSCGSLTYLVKPIGDGASHAWSLAHGAGRKWARSETRVRMRERFSVPELTRTPLGGRMICEERETLYEEAPAAYKNIEDVVQDLVDAELASVVATFRPLLTYKTRKAIR
jgi:release factor H-coupled RctB family protein